MAPRHGPAAALAGFLTVMGTLHFAAPRSFDQIIPEWLPGDRRTWTYASGVAEFAVAAAIAVPRTRRIGGLLAAGLFVAVFPANIKMALDSSHRPWRQRAIAYGRLPLQLPLVLWALKVRRDA
ncbi:DoxX family protein [Tenggerimyces flavus]|uniref:DoxX family protein n=1 Tax=Tenggerimyces flavus TaxID=1708749 RepID=A0ABV7Y9Y8_9ACTN|nr:hypothetical protein [Tenggerimyces flavus]MBM7789740.1 putative membrane protein [Tenggerimyces flavus]